MKTFVHIMQKTGYILACIGMAGMDSKDRLFPICFMVLGGLIMYGFTDREEVVPDETTGT